MDDLNNLLLEARGIWREGRWITVHTAPELLRGGWVVKQVAPPMLTMRFDPVDVGSHDQKWRYICRAHNWAA